MSLAVSGSEPIRTASNTVVIPAPATCASWLCSAAMAFQVTPGRGR